MSNEKILKHIENDIPLIQKYMNENIGNGIPKTGADIYKGVAKNLEKPIPESTFKNSLSENIRAGNIVGFVGKKRIGYIKIGDHVAPPKIERKIVTNDSDDESNSVDEKFTIQVSKTIRIALMDKLNFTMQRYRSGIWFSESYHRTLNGAIEFTIKYLLQNKLKESASSHSLGDVLELLNQIESSLMGQLAEMAGSMPLDKRGYEINQDDQDDDAYLEESEVA